MKGDSPAVIFATSSLSLIAVVAVEVALGFNLVYFIPSGVLAVLSRFTIWWNARKRSSSQQTPQIGA